MKQEPKFIVGKTLVRVMEKRQRADGSWHTVQIHEGVVLQETTTMLRVFNAAPTDKGGDVGPDTCQLYAKSAPLSWCEIIGERKTAHPIPAIFRR